MANTARPLTVFALAAMAVAAGAVSACNGPARFRPSHIGDGVVDIRRDELVLSHGEVGAGKFKGQGTYVLVDVFNPLRTDLEITLGGDLIDGQGAAVGPLNNESLRIPGGGRRTYALVHHKSEVRTAVGADIRVIASQLPKHPAPIRLEDANVARDGDRVIVRANLINESEKEVVVVVVAGFYDAAGKIMNRPFSVLKIPGAWKKPAQFVGPHGSARGYLFVGDQVY